MASAWLAVLWVLVASAQPSVSPAPTVPPTLAAYRAALDQLPPLPDLVFQYAESRVGPTRALSEEHRVYRSAAGDERNETIAVNGTAVVPAIVRFSTREQWPYDVRRFAVGEPEYNVMYGGATIVAGKRVLGFSTVRTGVGDFAITGLYLDPLRHLPVRETFEAGGGGCRGSGSIDFAPANGNWLPQAVSVSCAVAPGGETYRESIRFSDYQFPKAIPHDVFGGGQ